MEELGSGFYLAMHDLEIRGAGEVLGDSQSGEMQEVGFNLFTEMLNRAVAALKQGREPDLTQPLGIATEINLHTPALLPNGYAPDVHRAPFALASVSPTATRPKISTTCRRS